MNIRLLSAYNHLLDHQTRIKRKGSNAHSLVALPPEDQAQIQQYVETITAILLRKAALRDLQTPEGIEQILSQQIKHSMCSKLVIHLLIAQLQKQAKLHQDSLPVSS